MGALKSTNFPAGFNNVTMRGQSVLVTSPGQVFWVDSNTTTASRMGTFQKPFASLATALNAVVSGRGDTIMLKSLHAEAVASAGAITISQNGLRIIGVGDGAARPAFTFSTAVGASILITGSGVSIENVIGIAGIDSLTNPFHVQGAGCSLSIEWQDPSAAVEAVRAILTTAAADKLRVSLRYMGQTGGDACVNAIRLVGVDEALIDIDFYGKASTAVVEFVTTACAGVRIRGDMYNSGGGGAKNIIDTVGGSTWWADIVDSSAGMKAFGGSAALMTVGNPQRRLASKVISNAAASLTTGASPVTLFTVTGDVVARVWATIQTAITSTGGTGTLAIGVTGNTGAFIAATTADGTNFPTGAVWAGDTSPTLKSEVFSGTALNGAPIASSANIICTVATNSMTAGAITFYCEWYPASSSGYVVGA